MDDFVDFLGGKGVDKKPPCLCGAYKQEKPAMSAGILLSAAGLRPYLGMYCMVFFMLSSASANSSTSV